MEGGGGGGGVGGERFTIGSDSLTGGGVEVRGASTTVHPGGPATALVHVTCKLNPFWVQLRSDRNSTYTNMAIGHVHRG